MCSPVARCSVFSFLAFFFPQLLFVFTPYAPTILPQGNILEDATAVQILSEAKKVSDDITSKQAVAEETQTRIDSARKGYRMCGEFNAALFFCIADLAGVDAMYQYSLNWFVGLFLKSIAESGRSDVLTRRLDSINSHFTYSLYWNVCRCAQVNLAPFLLSRPLQQTASSRFHSCPGLSLRRTSFCLPFCWPLASSCSTSSSQRRSWTSSSPGLWLGLGPEEERVALTQAGAANNSPRRMRSYPTTQTRLGLGIRCSFTRTLPYIPSS